MPVTVKLKDIIDGMEMQMDEASHYLDLNTGEVIFVTDEDFGYAEDDEFDEDGFIPDWQKPQIEIARKILNSDNYLTLPDRYEMNEYQMMEDFIETQVPEKLQFHLNNAIRGSGAFRRFKDAIFHENLEKEWFAYKSELYKKVAIAWCQENDLVFTE